MTSGNKLFDNQIWFTTKEAAMYLRLSENALRIASSRFTLNKYILGKKSVRYKKEDLDKLVSPCKKQRSK